MVFVKYLTLIPCYNSAQSPSSTSLNPQELLTYNMSNYKDARTVDSESYPYIFEKNVSAPLSNGGLIRCNVYRPKDSDAGTKFPVLATYGPYGKDVPYSMYV